MVLAVSVEYGFDNWRVMFRQSERFVSKLERLRRKEATAVCVDVLSRLSGISRGVSAAALGHSDSFIEITKYDLGNYRNDFQSDCDRILSDLISTSDKFLR